ncbi:MAG: elongation factor Ts [Candidatus Omnitrophota bacterium]|nr:elongation factor Ts [Candidatus Omnitrophota bacterium]MDZ4241665.1 elongation factor Ts [Candidatus Omnitrophota bacterium]
MVVSADMIRELRELTSCGVIDCKKALEETHGDLQKAKDVLQKRRGAEILAKKGDRLAKEGRVEAYVHMGNKLAALVEVNCETDFVARSEEFCKFTKDLAMHIAAKAPRYIRREDVPQDVLAAQPDQKTFLKETCLLDQTFVRDESITIQDYLNSLVVKIGENIRIGRFLRYKVGTSE